jgi:hypothetical protein
VHCGAIDSCQLLHLMPPPPRDRQNSHSPGERLKTAPTSFFFLREKL